MNAINLFNRRKQTVKHYLFLIFSARQEQIHLAYFKHYGVFVNFRIGQGRATRKRTRPTGATSSRRQRRTAAAFPQCAKRTRVGRVFYNLQDDSSIWELIKSYKRRLSTKTVLSACAMCSIVVLQGMFGCPRIISLKSKHSIFRTRFLTVFHF